MSRIENTVRNTKFAIIGQFVGIIVNFVSRKIFVIYLGTEYLGLGGLFSNILSILTLAELGIGWAINFSLYKPLAEKDESKLLALMHFYKKVYSSISIIIFVLGAMITPYLHIFLKEIPSIPHLQLIFLMFVANTSVSYLFSYKRALIVTDQKGYITTIYRYTFTVGLSILQIIILITTRNYILFLSSQLIMTLGENILVSIKADVLYPFIRSRSISKLDSEEKARITKNTFAMVLHKVGTTVVMGTDNLIISKFIGLIEVGLYSNYLLILIGLNSVISQVFQSTIASIGHLGATETNERTLSIFESLDLFGYWVYAFSSVSLAILINPFISLWLGSSYLLPTSFVITIIANFYFSGMRKSVLSFRDALGLFWYDRYKPIFESLINLIFSIILVKQIGLTGVFLGTIISTISTCFWMEPRILYKYGFNKSVSSYFLNYVRKTLLLIAIGYLTYLVCELFAVSAIVDFILKSTICLIIPNTILFLIFRKNPRFKYLVQIFNNNVIKKR